MNLPNKLTVSRLWLTALFVLCFVLPFPGRHTVALFVFLAASLTDYFDGVIARKRGLLTDFGKLMDPLADKILTASAFISLCATGDFPAWAVIVIISREFLITGLRSLAASKGVVMPAERFGKHKTVWQMITILYFLLLLSLEEWSSAAWGDLAWRVGRFALIPVTVILTVYSGLIYLWKNRSLIETD
ncbi:MAG: CDP-diacylglycerol--glycerol-3-phosphate 3-phosphatidyltransferase [Chthoniobacterales bacterium]|nr:CDP-diacylglycerol--glycerol-3-phosphate 3-phosphatidyltransferase [Chthoniobacterales bacterium]